MKPALFTNLRYFFPLVMGLVHVLAPSKARNRATVWISLNMYMLSNDLWATHDAVYFLDATKIWVVYIYYGMQWYTMVCYIFTHLRLVKIRPYTRAISSQILSYINAAMYCLLTLTPQALCSPTIMRLYYLVCRLISRVGIHVAWSNHLYYYVLLYVLYIS